MNKHSIAMWCLDGFSVMFLSENKRDLDHLLAPSLYDPQSGRGTSVGGKEGWEVGRYEYLNQNSKT